MRHAVDACCCLAVGCTTILVAAVGCSSHWAMTCSLINRVGSLSGGTVEFNVIEC